MNSNNNSNDNNRNRQRVRFAPTCQLYTTLYSDAVRESIRQGSFRGELDDILGLERLLFDKIYLAKRAAFKGAVFEEQTWQVLSREMRRRRGLTCEGEVNGHVADEDIMTLANAAAMSSSWAKERASIAGLTLQSNLCTYTGSIGGRRQAASASDP
eukprot:scaffold1857_cov96-Skeletonema_dohrnii-CCMP3373.AAC.6